LIKIKKVIINNKKMERNLVEAQKKIIKEEIGYFKENNLKIEFI